MKQLDLFPGMPTVVEFKPKKLRHCKECQHIIAVKFSNGNIYFCTVQKGGRYGKKIKKSLTVNDCPWYVRAGDTPIPHSDGYYGITYDKGIKR